MSDVFFNEIDAKTMRTGSFDGTPVHSFPALLQPTFRLGMKYIQELQQKVEMLALRLLTEDIL